MGIESLIACHQLHINVCIHAVRMYISALYALEGRQKGLAYRNTLVYYRLSVYYPQG
jgi:hypothetical protein